MEPLNLDKISQNYTITSTSITNRDITLIYGKYIYYNIFFFPINHTLKTVNYNIKEITNSDYLTFLLYEAIFSLLISYIMYIIRRKLCFLQS
jgi:hypothetical protein